MPIFQPPPSIPMWPGSGCSSCTPSTIREDKLRVRKADVGLVILIWQDNCIYLSIRSNDHERLAPRCAHRRTVCRGSACCFLGRRCTVAEQTHSHHCGLSRRRCERRGGTRTGEKLSTQLNTPVVVENRAGAGGVIGMDAVAKAAPDGYTIGFSAISPLALTPHLNGTPFDPARDITPL